MTTESVHTQETELEPFTLPEGPFKGVVVKYGNMHVKPVEDYETDNEDIEIEFSYSVMSTPEAFNTTPEELEKSPDFIAYIKAFTLKLIESYVTDKAEKLEQTEEKNTTNSDTQAIE